MWHLLLRSSMSAVVNTFIAKQHTIMVKPLWVLPLLSLMSTMFVPKWRRNLWLLPLLSSMATAFEATYLNGEATVASAAPLVHVSAGHFSHGPTLFNKGQHIRVVLHHELAQPIFKWTTKKTRARVVEIRLESAHIPLDWCTTEAYHTNKRRASLNSAAD